MDNPSFNEQLQDLTHSHMLCSRSYKNIIDSFFFGVTNPSDIYLHSNLFKKNIFLPNSSSDYSSFQSSGTTGSPSTIYFSRSESISHQRNLLTSVRSFLDIPRSSLFLELSSPGPALNNARKAASNGFSLLCRKKRKLYLTTNDDAISQLKAYADDFTTIVLFGFTYEIYSFIQSLLSSHPSFRLDHPIYLIHGGGWKKLENQKVDIVTFNNMFKHVFPSSHIMNYYGMVEQLGSIYPMCEFNNHHTVFNNDIIVRDFNGYQLGIEEAGLIQTLSLLPRSYPGHSILTEDLGIITGINTCKCGRPGTTFKVLGRVERSVAKGCSDAY